MLRTISLACALALAASTASAQSVTVTADAGFRLIRCIDQFGMASCEFITEQKSGPMTCIAFDKADTPIASTVTLVELGAATFMNLDARTIAKVLCRR